MPNFPLRDALLAWAGQSGRRLPSLDRSDPWAIFVLEVVSQQTQIGRAIERANRFLARFPTPAALAEATPADAIREWAGLGYYRRAVKLREAAIEIVAKHGGEVPATVEALAGLPGIGPYTSRSVAVHAFGSPVAPLDTNVRRVAGRFFGEGGDLQTMADTLVAGPEPARVVRALMDLATVVCRAKSPNCRACPLAPGCASAFAPVISPEGARKPAQPFAGSRRWLRGRILERLSTIDHGEWLPIDRLAADLAHSDVPAALDRMAADGLIELAGEHVRLAGQ